VVTGSPPEKPFRPSSCDRADDRGVSFGVDAARYDAFRPDYPFELVRRLTAGRPRRVLDIGCGTGIAGRLFASRGCDVLGVEPDARMAAFARQSGIPVETGYFEDWDPRGRTFDLVVCAQAWWWLDVPSALPKIADVLVPGGRLGVFWNVGGREDELSLALRDVYERAAAKAVRVGSEGVREPMLPAAYEPDPRQDIQAEERFSDVEALRWQSVRRYTRDEWVAAAATFGDVIALPRKHREALLADVGVAIDEHGGVRDVSIVTSLVIATRA
jgi:SAM-dependent methyltransferase